MTPPPYTYTTALQLTSPLTSGPKVANAQRLLAGHNRFAGTDFPVAPYTGRVDSQFGQRSAAACARAKYLLGYPEDELKPIFGSQLYGYLTSVRLPLEFQQRRKDRVDTTPKEAAFALAQTQIGTKEHPFGSNRQKYGAWYGMNGVAWCGIFCSWCFAHATPALPRIRYAFVPWIIDDASVGKNGLSLTFQPVRGDLVSYTVSGTPNAHVAFFDEWVDPNNHGSFYDLGGNTGPSDISNGGAVLRQLRSVLQVTHFVRVW